MKVLMIQVDEATDLTPIALNTPVSVTIGATNITGTVAGKNELAESVSVTHTHEVPIPPGAATVVTTGPPA